MAAHMVVAAYVVGGFLIASVYAVGMLRGRTRPLPPPRVPHPVLASRPSRSSLQMAVGDSLARWVYNNQPVKFAAIELVPQTHADVPETLFGHLNSNGTVTGGIPIPGLASILSDPNTGTSTVVQGLNTVPAGDEPTIAEVNIVHLAWDVMVGARHADVPARGLVRGRLDLPAPACRRSRWFLRAAAGAGVLAGHHAGGRAGW